MDLKFKNYSCFVCFKRNFSKTEFYQNMFDERFNILKCNTCKSYFIDKIPLNIETYNYLYDVGGSDSTLELSKVFRNLRIIKTKKYLKKFLNTYLVKNNTILDFGGGDGYLSYAIKEINPNLKVFLSDISKPNSIYTEEINFLTIEELERSNNKFDVIILRHVLEHLENPLETINFLYEKLNTGGVIFIEVPNFDLKNNIVLKFVKNQWTHIALPWHFNHFSQSSFSKMLEGFTISFEKYNVTNAGQFVWLLSSPFRYLRTFTLKQLFFISLFPIFATINFITPSHTAIILKIHKEN